MGNASTRTSGYGTNIPVDGDRIAESILSSKVRVGKRGQSKRNVIPPIYDISKSDVDKFLSESNRKQIDHRLLIATTDRIGANARQVLDAQEKSVVRYLLAHFESAAVEFPDSIQSLSTGKRKPPPELDRPHQIEAVDAVLSGFQTASRGQLIMACGTGKTFVCLWVKERLKAKRTLVLVPSLNLLSQMLNEWTFAAREPFDALCVCSDQTVNRRDDDEAISLAADFPFPVSNDVNEIADFLKADKDQVIFSTYQSSPLVAQAQKRPDVPHFDLVIADEAHRCAGKSDTVFGTVLDDRLIKSDRRLFATATPRVYRTSLKKAAEEFGVEVVDMNDEKQFRKTVSHPDVWRGHQTRAAHRLSSVDRWRRQRARQGVDREPSACRNRYRACDRRQIAGGTNRTAESNQGLEPSQVDLLSWPREGSACIFGRHRPSCPSGWTTRIDRQAIFGQIMCRVKCLPLPAGKNSSD